ncbi:MAG: hypothetical protein ACLFWM_06960 [Actinomycetota bacterium]
MADGTPRDLEALVEETMELITEATPSHRACLGDLTITHAWELEDRAHYMPDTRTVVLRVPATAPELRFSLAHEVAHHLEMTCEQAGMRPAFLSAQGHPPDQAWFQGESWETTPSEQFATAFATFVVGQSDPDRHLDISEGALEVVSEWARTGTAPGVP